VPACNAYEALRNFNARPFDAYVLDYWLPDWSGPSLCREIRKTDPNSPVVFYTDAASDQDRHRAMRAGASAYLCKPVEPDELRSSLGSLFTRSDVESLLAKTSAERAVDEVLVLRLARARPASGAHDESAARSLERAARARAYKVFIESGGTRANFDSWWPQVFGSARANHGLA
jgi:DNA-binding response OmpR family regulator